MNSSTNIELHGWTLKGTVQPGPLTKGSSIYVIQTFWNLPRVWYPGETISIGVRYIGESISPGTQTQVIQAFWGLIPGKSIFSESQTPASQSSRSHKTGRVNLPGVVKPVKLISPVSQTPTSQSPQSLRPLWVSFRVRGFSGGFDYEKN